jgi:hypothetical protein
VRDLNYYNIQQTSCQSVNGTMLDMDNVTVNSIMTHIDNATSVENVCAQVSQPDTALTSTMLLIITVAIAFALRSARSSFYFGRQVGNIIEMVLIVLTDATITGRLRRVNCNYPRHLPVLWIVF